MKEPRPSAVIYPFRYESPLESLAESSNVVRDAIADEVRMRRDYERARAKLQLLEQEGFYAQAEAQKLAVEHAKDDWVESLEHLKAATLWRLGGGRQ